VVGACSARAAVQRSDFPIHRQVFGLEPIYEPMTIS
jgi:hypothetical protein